MGTRMKQLRWASVAALMLVAACGGTAQPATQPSPDSVKGNLSVFAAASLTESFNAAGTLFAQLHPGVNVQFNFAGTPTLLTQIQQGAVADVFASADQTNMQKAVAGGLVTGTGKTFTKNKLEIVVAAGNPKHIIGLADLARADVLFITEAPTVPAGKYGAQALSAAGVKAIPKSEEADVKSVISKVELGEADAGIVYVTDVRAAGSKVSGVEIPDTANVIATYPLAQLKDAKNPVAATAFIDYLLSPEGQKLLMSFGFVQA